MYLAYFGLQRPPFRMTPDPSMFCPGGGRGEILEALIYAITSGEGIIKVVGEVGSGKTMLCRILEERLPTTVEIVYLANPRLSPADILHAIAFELKLPVTAATERLLVMQHLQDYLLQQHGAGRSVVVFIEEAQGMPIETLEEIRLLSNLETHHHKLLQIVVFGQPELDNNLRKRHIRQLKERITHSFYLEPLGVAEVAEYLRFRLQASGCSRSEVFDRGAVKMIAKASRGLIRRITILADKAMLAAYAAPGEGSLSGDSRKGVNARHVRAAIGDCEFGQSRIRPTRMVGYGLLASFFIVAAVFIWHRFPAVSSLPSLLTAKAKLIDRIPVAGSTRTVEKGSEDSGTKVLAVEQQGEEKPDLSEDLIGAMPHKTARTSATSLVNSRREATAQWLQKVDPDNYTIQLLAASVGEEMHLEKYFQRISSESMLNRSYICLVRQGENDRWVVLYDEFQGVKSARRALDDLPSDLRHAQPFVRSLNKVLLSLQVDNKQNL